MIPRSGLLLVLSATCLAQADQKWVWGENRNRDSRRNFENEPRYEVFENNEPFRPSRPFYERPPSYNRPELLPPHRPGGLYSGNGPSSTYGPNHPHYNPDQEILTGPIPSWVKEGPFKTYDKCKCTEKFNCNTPGISYGHCDVGKQYCCYSTKKQDQIGGPNPSKLQHSIENGILVGPGGPADRPGGGSFRPGGGGYRPGGGAFRPSGFGLQGGSGGFGLSGSGGGGGFGSGPSRVEYLNHRPVHSDGILVGPGGPFDRPGGNRPGGGGFGFGRANKN